MEGAAQGGDLIWACRPCRPEAFRFRHGIRWSPFGGRRIGEADALIAFGSCCWRDPPHLAKQGHFRLELSSAPRPKGDIND